MTEQNALLTLEEFLTEQAIELTDDEKGIVSNRLLEAASLMPDEFKLNKAALERQIKKVLQEREYHAYCEIIRKYGAKDAQPYDFLEFYNRDDKVIPRRFAVIQKHNLYPGTVVLVNRNIEIIHSIDIGGYLRYKDGQGGVQSGRQNATMFDEKASNHRVIG